MRARSSAPLKCVAGEGTFASLPSRLGSPPPTSFAPFVAPLKADPVRLDRAPDALRRVTLERRVAPYAEGSCLVAFGDTRVLCTASVEEGVPGWRRGRGEGWLTAE